MKQIDDFFSPTANTTLYHYTGISGLLGIVEARKIWASHAYYLSDSKEILHACEVLTKVLTEMAVDVHEEEHEFVKQFAQWLDTFRVNAYHIFIFSLSAERNLLSQWRSYTPHGKGVCLAFSSSVLNEILKTSGSRIAQCLYDRQPQEELMNALLQKMLETFRQRLPHLDTSRCPPAQKYYGLLEEFRGDLLQVLAIIKDPAFQEEREWRIVSPYYPLYTVPEIKFREGACMLMPYIELGVSVSDSQPLFEEVILGPSEHANLSISALSSYLSNKKASNKTANSLIPFRQW